MDNNQQYQKVLCAHNSSEQQSQRSQYDQNSPLQSFKELSVDVSENIINNYRPVSIIYYSTNSIVITAKQIDINVQQQKWQTVIIKFSESVNHEHEILQQIHNKSTNINQFVNIIGSYNNALVMKHYPGTLRKLINKNNNIESKIIMRLLRDCVQVLQILQQLKIVHCDIKPDNFVYQRDQNGDIKYFVLIDFANSLHYQQIVKGHLSQLFSKQQSFEGKQITYQYVAPECLDSQILHPQKIDIWGVGCVLFQCLTGESLLPFETDSKQAYKQYLNQFANQTSIGARINRFCAPSQIKIFKDINLKLLKVKYTERATLKDIIDFISQTNL